MLRFCPWSHGKQSRGLWLGVTSLRCAGYDACAPYDATLWCTCRGRFLFTVSGPSRATVSWPSARDVVQSHVDPQLVSSQAGLQVYLCCFCWSFRGRVKLEVLSHASARNFCDVCFPSVFARSKPCVTGWRREIGWSGWSPCDKMTCRLGVTFGPPSANDHMVHACVIATQLSATRQALHSQDRQTNGTRSSAPPVRGARVAHVRQVRARASRRSFVDTRTGTSETVFPASSREACCSFVAHEAQHFWCLQQSSLLTEGRACSPGLCPHTFSSNTSSCCTFSSLTSIPQTLLRSRCPNVPWLQLGPALFVTLLYFCVPLQSFFLGVIFLKKWSTNTRSRRWKREVCDGILSVWRACGGPCECSTPLDVICSKQKITYCCSTGVICAHVVCHVVPLLHTFPNQVVRCGCLADEN